MAIVNTYTLRLGRPMPVLCDTGGTAEDVISYTFGSECQQVETCAADENVAPSAETCLMNMEDDAIYSATYRAHPVTVDGKIIFNSTVTRKPIATNNYRSACGSRNCIFDT